MDALVVNPIPTWVDSTGMPLQGGSIYIGVPNTDPTKNPVSVFQDSALSIPFPQPISVTNGMPSLGGSPRQMFLGAGIETYSIAVFDSGGNLLQSLPNVLPVATAAAAGNVTLNEFVAGTDFTPGTTTSLTLSAAPGSGYNVSPIFLDGAPWFFPDDFILNGDVVTFTSPIPNGIQRVRAMWGLTSPIGTPADGSVTSSSLAPGSVLAAAIQQPSTGQFWTQNGAGINRMNDRVFIGGATASDAAYPPVNLSWLQAYQETIGYTNQSLFGALCVETADSSAAAEVCAAEFGAQSLYAASAGSACIGVESYAINNNAALATGAWAYYGEAHRVTPAAGSVYCIETDAYNIFDSIAPTPYAQGDVIGYQIGSGAGTNGVQMTASIAGSVLTVTSATPELPTSKIAVGNNVFGVGVPAGTTIISLGTGTGGVGTYNLSTSSTIAAEYMVATPQFDSSAALQIVNNPTKWKAGIVFGAKAISGCDGQSGTGIAISLAKGHQITWYNQGGAPAASIFSGVSNPSNGTGIQFTDNGLQINSTAGPALAYFKPLSTAANWLEFNAANTGSPVMIAANGSDSNVGITFQMKGSASPAFTNVALASSATSGGAGALPATPAQYLILYLNGAAMKVPAYNA